MRQLEHEVHRKAIQVTADGLVENLRADVVEPREISIEHDALAADNMNQRVDLGDFHNSYTIWPPI